jgi:hypothetical protein
LAAWGDRLAIESITFGGVGSWQTETIVLREIDEDGHIIFSAVFDPDNRRDAFVELADRYATGEGRDYADVLDLDRRMSRAYEERDWETFANLHADDFVMIDHRPVSVGGLSGRQAAVEYNRTLVDLAPDVRVISPEIIAIAPDRALRRLRMIGSTPDGSDMELESLGLGVHRKGRVKRIEFFPRDSLEEAMARFEELGSEGLLPR